MSEFRVRCWCPPEDLPKSKECLYCLPVFYS